ncbi:RibT protein [Companilactobacillus sp.]|jgi:riboflavin biosynthesis RibT protein|uniref:RibT protein n=1 Tax=Companilactobacillus sp. TaxID=2767905 RepID=UPI0025BADF90|nr:RibT protein [Companilactobacillus sp.]MCH4008318.1 RibT protein [Companilactobacillus sp.]MCH4051503.1 RibT protein [Companilactobacillus sp.]MCH4076261.1 RibT protein [Companilactobacillus sp.]MCH4124836.1 RibT protein [Companilactobacillus sp.]MCH4131378.1 RibT protein [Companilactobacillus sp.]
MLTKYNREENQKIAMGFLSYIPDLKDMSNLEQELKLYDEDENRQLYLWKSNVEDYSGIVALSFSTKTVFIEYISLNPSYRSQSNHFKIFDDIKRKFPNYTILGSFSLVDELRKWTESQKEEMESD